jgi:hypothetical protein
MAWCSVKAPGQPYLYFTKKENDSKYERAHCFGTGEEFSDLQVIRHLSTVTFN